MSKNVKITFNFLPDFAHGERFQKRRKVHSLSSGKVAATPILKFVPLQFSLFIL